MTNSQPKNVTIPVELAQAVLNYLAEQKYRDVWQMIQALQQAQPVDVASKPTLVKKDEAN